MDMEVRVPLERINLREGKRSRLEEPVAKEETVNLYVNGQHVVSLLASPGLRKELALGWLLDEGIIPDLKNVDEVLLKDNDVRVRIRGDVSMRLKVGTMVRLVTSACGSLPPSLKLLDDVERPLVRSDYSVRAEEVLRMVGELNRLSKTFRTSGGTHSAALFCEGEMLAQAEDVGRHNAVDKVIGAAALKGVDFDKCVLVSSGRQTVDMPLKAARVGIPIVASVTAPTNSAVMAADRVGVTLICFVRGEKMNVYSNPQRVTAF